MEEQILAGFVMRNGTSAEVRVRTDLVLLDVLEQLVLAGLIGPLPEDQGWGVLCMDRTAPLNVWRTLAQNGITDGTYMRVVQGPEYPRTDPD